MHTHRTADASLYSMIHSLLDEQEPLRAVDRRAHNRRPYDCAQLMAPYDGSTLPKQTGFRLVQCQDLSPTGFSFLSPEPPGYEFLVIALGAVPFKFFLAQVMHAQECPLGTGDCYLVGCQFLNRLKV